MKNKIIKTTKLLKLKTQIFFKILFCFSKIAIINVEWDRLVFNEKIKQIEKNINDLIENSKKYDFEKYDFDKDNIFAQTKEINEFLQNIQVFLERLSKILNDLKYSSSLTKTTIDNWKSSIITARNNINKSVLDLSNAKDNLNSKFAFYKIAKEKYNLGNEGSRKEDINVAQASYNQALAGLKSAQINLEKTILRSPISGTINSFDLKKGDYINTGQAIATISNNNALEITAYLTEDDKKEIDLNSIVIIKNKFKSKITKISPALDQKTKKIEIKIIADNSKLNLINGQSVNLKIKRNILKNNKITLPVIAIKMGTDGSYVFLINNENNTLIKRKVKLGVLFGNKVEIKSGILSTDFVVTDARGLKHEQLVEILES